MKVAWSCLLDDTPALWASTRPWIKTAIELGGIEASRLYVHHVCPLPESIGALCREFGVHTCRVEPFDARYPTNNKIQQTATDFGDAEAVILTDADMVFTGPPPFAEIHQSVHGKLVDHPNPPLKVLKKIFRKAGLKEPPVEHLTYVNLEGRVVEFDTYSGNYNGGLYGIERSKLLPLGEAWGKWSRWLMKRVRLAKRWTHHLDQIAFCMAVNELGYAVGELDDAWNFPMHMGVTPEGREPFILHHHLDFSDGFALHSAMEIERIRPAIERVNRVMR